MRLDVTFQETKQNFTPRFGAVHNVSDGGFERGYEAGKQYADGIILEMNNEIDLQKELLEQAALELEGKVAPALYEQGYADGYNNGMDAIVNQTAVSYSNDTITALSVSFFQNNKYLETISLPKVTHLNGFLGCTALKNCNFSGAKYIQSGIFKGCVSLEKLDFPSAEQIHSNTFENCTSLKTLILRRTGSIVSLGNINSFTNTPIANGTGFIYVPDNLVDKYKAATNWSTYASQIKPLSELEV